MHCCSGLVEVNVWETATMESVESHHVGVRSGGRWSPANCNAWQKLAIIVTYRDRHEQLVLLLNRLHTMLQRQMMYYQIFVIQQVCLHSFHNVIITVTVLLLLVRPVIGSSAYLNWVGAIVPNAERGECSEWRMGVR